MTAHAPPVRPLPALLPSPRLLYTPPYIYKPPILLYTPPPFPPFPSLRCPLLSRQNNSSQLFSKTYHHKFDLKKNHTSSRRRAKSHITRRYKYRSATARVHTTSRGGRECNTSTGALCGASGTRAPAHYVAAVRSQQPHRVHKDHVHQQSESEKRPPPRSGRASSETLKSTRVKTNQGSS